MTPEEVRGRLAVALDVDDLDAACTLACAVAEHFGVAKVGLELYSAAGPAAVRRVAAESGMAVFVDVKLHDIPETVRRAGAVLGRLGARYVTLHAAGGEAMLSAGVEGLGEGAERAGLPAPMALAVTVLTSEKEAQPELLVERVRAALSAGCGGVVCAAADLATVTGCAPGIFTAVPGIRPKGALAGDQARVATPAEAMRAGASMLVIGRPVTRAGDPAAAAAAIVDEACPR